MMNSLTSLGATCSARIIAAVTASSLYFFRNIPRKLPASLRLIPFFSR